MKTLLSLRALALSLLLFAVLPAVEAGEDYVVLSYHDVQDDPVRDRLGDAVTIATADLVAHFAWLREHHYVPVSLDDVAAARTGRKPLPDNAVLLTFDDGYASTYTRVFPLLKLFGYPAVVAPMAAWIDAPADGAVDYGANPLPRTAFMTWAQLKELADSGLVELASHSYDLHHGVAGNPQGNLEPAAVTRIYDGKRHAYEDDTAYLDRVGADLEKSARAIERRTGHRPRAVVWPYGRYNEALTALADKLGMGMSFDLGDTGANLGRDTGVIHRALMTHQATLETLIAMLNEPVRRPVVRAVRVSLDRVYDADPAQQERNLDLLLDRIRALNINTVYLQAFADPDGDGSADALYFPNRRLPMRADLFNRVAWQLDTRTGVKVYAWLPVLAFTPPEGDPLRDAMVMRATDDAAPPRPARLSPFDPAALDFAGDIYEDLARQAYVSGLLFHDDATLAEDEDASAAAVEVYTREWDLPAAPAEIRATPDLLQTWTLRKTQRLFDWTDALAARARAWQPQIRTARQVQAAVVLDASAQARYAQSYALSLARYDYVVVPAPGTRRGRPAALDALVTQVAHRTAGMEKTVFELQGVDPHDGTPVETAALRAQMDRLRQLGARHLGYSPNEFIDGRPAIAGIRPAMSLGTYPYPE